MRYGYIGLGHLGGHLAASLIRAGSELTVYDRDPALAERHRAMGATVAGSAAELAGQVDHVFTCLPSPQVSEAVGKKFRREATGAPVSPAAQEGTDLTNSHSASAMLMKAPMPHAM